MEPKKNSGRSDRLKMRLAYSLGGISMHLPWILTSVYLVYFLTDIASIPPFVVLILYSGAHIVNAVSAPLIGVLADRTSSPWGRYRPWIFIGAVLLVPAAAFLLWTQPDWNTGKGAVSACIVYGFAMVFSAIWEVPYGALNSCMTADPDEQTKLTGIRVFAYSAACVAAGIVFLAVAAPTREIGNTIELFAKIALLLCLLAIPLALFCCRHTKETVLPSQNQSVPLKTTLAGITQNPSFMTLLPGFFVFGFLSCGRMTVAMYYFAYVVQDAGSFAVYSLVNGVLTGLGAFFGMNFLLRLFHSKRSACIFGYSMLIASSVVLCAANPISLGVHAVLVALWLGSVASGVVTGLIYSMIPDSVAYSERQTGVRADGFLYGAASFMNKLGGAVGPVFLSALLGLAGYAGENVVQPRSALSMINICMNLMPVLLSAAAILSLLFCRADDSKIDLADQEPHRQILDGRSDSKILTEK